MSKHTVQSNKYTKVFDTLYGQDFVKHYLEQIVEQQAYSHAYLFTGPKGSGKLQAAYMLAQALVCEHGGCMSCDACMRAHKKSHPDIYHIEPQGAQSYLIQQIRDLLDDVARAPLRAAHKIYIIEQAEVLGSTCANALLKTLEEPPSHAVFILLARQTQHVLPTISSRCQLVPFKRIAFQQALDILEESTGHKREECARGLAACAGSVTQAREFVLSRSHQALRIHMLHSLDLLENADELDVLQYAKQLIEEMNIPLDEAKNTQSAYLKEHKDFLTAKSTKEIEERHKRQLSSYQRLIVEQLFNICRSWLEDMLMLTNLGTYNVCNDDALVSMQRIIKRVDACQILSAIKAVEEAQTYMQQGVSVQLVLEVMLLRIREVLWCSR